ncbi:MAG: SOS response-associated peptidase [Anaerolineae bacterium]|nr:SOS response-associated peptidase [Anaerolineae bacterium]
MCGRFVLTQTDEGTLVAAFEIDGVPVDLNLGPRYNVAPTQSVITVVQDADTGSRHLRRMRWGLIPSWAKDPTIGSRMINARGETVHEKPSFRAALKRRRCLVIADGFYEWQAQPDGPKQPVFITLQDRAPFGMAGLYEYWTEQESAQYSGETLVTCTIITGPPNELIAPIHNRMPAILPREDYAAWLDPDRTDSAEVMPLILRPYPAEAMTFWPVSRAINSPANDDPSLIERVG